MPNHSRLADTVRGLWALVRLVVLVAGVPVALVVSVRALAPGSGGAPWPEGVPRLAEVASALSRPGQLPVGALAKAIAALAWLGWVELMAAVVADVAGRVGGRRPRRLPLPLAGRSQALAGRLVATAALVSALWWHPARPSAAATAPPPTPYALAVAEAPAATTAQPAPAVLAPGTKVHLVRSGDWLSKIAEAHLGSWRRYPEIMALNRGRPQPDGRALVDEDLIRPGWVLVMPDDAVGVDVVPAPPVPDPPPPPAPAPEPTPATSPGAKALPTPAVVPSAAPATPAAGPTFVPAHSGGDGSERTLALVGIGVPASLAAGVVWKLRGLRHAQQRRRRRGRDVPRPDPALEPAERRVRAVAGEEAAEWLDLALRLLGVALAEWPAAAVPAVEVVRAGRFGVEVLLDRPCPDPPEHFCAADEDQVWRLDADLDLGALKELAGDAPVLLPAMVTVGTTADGPVLVDLERAGTLAVEGDPDAVAAVVAGAALELATAPWAADTALRLAGGDARLATLEQVEVLGDPAAFAAVPWSGLDLDGAATTLAARVGGPESLPPTVVVAAPAAVDDDVLAAIAAKAAPGTSGLALVAAGAVPGARWRLVIGPDRSATLEPLGLPLRCEVDAGTVADLVALVAGAADEGDGDELVLPPPAPEPARAAERHDAPLVRVLGPVEVPWANPPARRVRSEEIVAYLAVHHPRVIPADRLLVAVHPLRDDGGGEVARSTFRGELSRVRNGLGTDPEGSWYLPTATREGYRIALASDWSRFRDLTAQAERLPASEARPLLAEALALVRGRPFEDVPESSFGWAWSEGVVSTMEVAVAEAAEQLAKLALEAGDPAQARWAARQGVLVIPSREALYQAWMRSAAATGNLDDLEQAWRDLWRALRAVDPLEEPRPDTLRLYESLRTSDRRIPEPAG